MASSSPRAIKVWDVVTCSPDSLPSSVVEAKTGRGGYGRLSRIIVRASRFGSSLILSL